MYREPPVDYIVPDFCGLWTPHITPLPHGWGIALAKIGPKLAELMLTMNVDNQRNLVNSNIGRFGDDMKAGSWLLTHQGIAFNKAGRLHDGQNRLWASVESGAEFESWVWFGVGAKAEMVVIDTGKSRTVVDAANVLELEIQKNHSATVTAYLRFAAPGRSFCNPRFSRTRQLELIQKYRVEIDVVHGWFGSPKLKGIDRAPIRGAVLAALVGGVPAATLQRFVGVLTDVEPATTQSDTSAKVLRTFVVNNVEGNSKGIGQDVGLYLRTCAAIQRADRGELSKQARLIEYSPWVAEENQRMVAAG
jgi:hypothetical protein